MWYVNKKRPSKLTSGEVVEEVEAVVAGLGTGVVPHASVEEVSPQFTSHFLALTAHYIRHSVLLTYYI